ncbi:MAG: pectate lyase [Alistipes sp.]|nr:pectate lyase [Alistipes sp.]
MFIKQLHSTAILVATLGVIFTATAKPKQSPDDEVRNAMRRATEFMMEKASYKGGFVWNYLPDFSRQWGEMEAKRTMVWIQPPGTPSVGHLLLDAYHCTGDEYYYEQAKRVANALIWGQLPCGGWNYVFDFAGENSLKEWYSTVGKAGWRLEEFQHYYGNATYDDGGTMEAASFLLRMYVEKNDPTYRPALDKVIQFVLESQYPIGGWPQRYPLRHDHPFQGRADYSSFITLNDDVIPGVIEFLTQCYQALGMQNLKEPILRAMYLIPTLQQGAPYAGWADQYTVEDLKPAHARSYEPRAINTSTTAEMVHRLMEYYKLTADSRFLIGIPAAIEYLETLALPEDIIKRGGFAARRRFDPNSESFTAARFIHPETGEPQFVHREGSNVYNGRYFYDQNPEGTLAHYGSFTSVNPKALREAYEAVKQLPKEELAKESPFLNMGLVPLKKYYTRVRQAWGIPIQKPTEERMRKLISEMTEEGYWLTLQQQTSNPYKPCTDMTPSTTREFTSTYVGDEFDTSPYTAKEPVKVISVRTYIDNMMQMIQFLDCK